MKEEQRREEAEASKEKSQTMIVRKLHFEQHAERMLVVAPGWKQMLKTAARRQ